MKRLWVTIFIILLAFLPTVESATSNDFVKIFVQDQNFFTHKDLINSDYIVGSDKIFYGSKTGNVKLKIFLSEKNAIGTQNFRVGVRSKGSLIKITEVSVDGDSTIIQNSKFEQNFIFQPFINIGKNIEEIEIELEFDPLDVGVLEEIDIILYNQFGEIVAVYDPFISGFGARQKGILDTTQLGSDVDANHTILYYIDPSNTEFWTTDTLGTGNGITFAQSDEITEYDFNVEAFDNADNNAWFWVEVTETFTSATDLNTWFYYDGVDVDNSDGTGTYPATYTAVYHLQEPSGTLGADSTSNGFDLTHRNTPTLNVQSQIDKGVKYVSANSEDSTNGTLLDGGYSALSFSFWVNKTAGWDGASTPSERSFSKENNSGGEDQLNFIWRINTGKALIRITSGVTQFDLATTKISWNANQWFHIVGTFDSVGDEMKIYIDGSLDNNLSTSIGAVGSGTFGDFFLGSSFGTGLFSNETLDEVKIFDGVVLTADEVKLIFLSESNQLITFGAEELAFVAPTVVVNFPNGGQTFDRRLVNSVDINFTISDPDSNSFLVDLNFSTNSSQGTGTPITTDLNTLDIGITCVANGIERECIFTWDISAVANNNYFILVNVTDQDAQTGFDQSDSTFQIIKSVVEQGVDYERYFNPLDDRKDLVDDANKFVNPALVEDQSGVLRRNEEQNQLLSGIIILLVVVIVIAIFAVFFKKGN